MITAIIFDCFGVLTIDPWKEFCSSLAPAVRKQAQDLNYALDGGYITQREFVEQVHKLTGQQTQAIEAVFSPKSPKNHALLEYITELKQQYKIGLISNISSTWITDEFLTTKEQQLFDDMVLSFQVGATKPEPRIFQIACDNLDVQPDQVIFIDDLDLNVTAAQEFGMQGIVYQNFVQTKQALQALLANTN